MDADRVRMRRYEEALYSGDMTLGHGDRRKTREALAGAVIAVADEEQAELRRRLTAVEVEIRDEPLIVSGIRRDLERTPEGRGGELHHKPATPGWGGSGCPGDNLLDWVDRLRTALSEEGTKVPDGG